MVDILAHYLPISSVCIARCVPVCGFHNITVCLSDRNRVSVTVLAGAILLITASIYLLWDGDTYSIGRCPSGNLASVRIDLIIVTPENDISICWATLPAGILHYRQ